MKKCTICRLKARIEELENQLEEAKQLADYFQHATTEMLPRMQGSALSIIINGKPDIKLCLEVGGGYAVRQADHRGSDVQPTNPGEYAARGIAYPDGEG